MEKITAVVLAVIGALWVATNAGDMVQASVATPQTNATTLGNNNTMLSITTKRSPASNVSNYTTPVNGRNITFTTLTNTSASPNPVTQNNRSDGVSQPANNTSPKPLTPTPRSITKKATPGPDKPTTKSISTTKFSTTSSTRSSTRSPNKSGHSNAITYIIIFIIVILCLLGAVVYCCFFQNKTRRFSLDHHSKNEDAQIPLSTVEPEVFEASPPKDMQTFSAPPEEVKNQEEEKGACQFFNIDGLY
ncbi:hypothetical protein NFI96_018671 [Prochilodus magdalenae]|nr:hypothetical protein NFI96_018671 [Prochilodus magdalenae]